MHIPKNCVNKASLSLLFVMSLRLCCNMTCTWLGWVTNPSGMVHGIVGGETDNEGVIQAIPKRKAEDLIQVIRSGMHGYHSNTALTHQQSTTSSFSIADELTKFAKLKEQGAITDDEYERIKKGLLEGRGH